MVLMETLVLIAPLGPPSYSVYPRSSHWTTYSAAMEELMRKYNGNIGS